MANYRDTENELYWFENLGDGEAFAAGSKLVHVGGRQSRTAELIDADGDGDLDLFTFERSNKIWWHEQIDRLRFSEPQEISLPANVIGHIRTIELRDIDEDGDTDVLATFWARNPSVSWFENRVIGDSNDDGVFNSSDFVTVFRAAEYEDGIANNSTFDEGDWNSDGEFDSSDLVLAFQLGGYQASAKRVSDQFAAAIDGLSMAPQVRSNS